MMTPLSHSPVVIEIELVPTAAEVVQTGWDGHADGGGTAEAKAMSTGWEVSNPRIQASLATLSTAGQAEFDRLMATSGVILNAKQYTSLQQTVTGSSIRANFFISKSNIEDMFLTYYGTPQYNPQGGLPECGHQNDTHVIQQRLQSSYKAVNFFPHQNFYYLDGNGTNA